MSTDHKTTCIERSERGPRTSSTLASMPYEIKENIVYWVHIIDQESSSIEDVDSLGLDTQKESSDAEDFSFENALSTSQTSSNRDDCPDLSSAAKISSSTDLNALLGKMSFCSSGIKSLCLVDHTFYELCRPWLWGVLRFRGLYEIKKLDFFSTDVFPKHWRCVRSFRWEMPNFEISQLDAGVKYKWDTNPIFLGMLKAFEKLENLDIHICPSFNPKIYIEPVSKLKTLISLSLSSTGGVYQRLQEDFLVSLLTELNLLQSFTCSGIVPAPDMELPLGLCLSGLKYLSVLHLERADCVNLSWSKLNWTGQIEKLTLRYCRGVTIEVIYHLTKCFSSTLYELDAAFEFLMETQDTLHLLDHLDTDSQDFEEREYNFNLPRLHILHLFMGEVAFPLTRFVKSFTTDCKELMELNLSLGQSPSKHQAEVNSAMCISPLITKEFLEESIRDKAWPNLRKIEVGQFGWSFTHIQSLRAMGIKLIYKGDVLHDDEEEEDHDELWEDSMGNDDDDDDDDDDIWINTLLAQLS